MTVLTRTLGLCLVLLVIEACNSGTGLQPARDGSPEMGIDAGSSADPDDAGLAAAGDTLDGTQAADTDDAVDARTADTGNVVDGAAADAGGGPVVDAGMDRQPWNPGGPFSKEAVDAGTTFVAENDGTWLMADCDRDNLPDLVFIKTSNTATAKVEVHIASASSGYQKRILETGTTFTPETDGTWLMADYDRDNLPDLVFIKTSNTATARVEVHIASASSGYQTRILETATTFTPETDGTWLMADYDRDNLPDLVFIKTSNTATGTVEVHVASAASKYQTRIFETGTTFTPETDGTWLMADYDRDNLPDLAFIKTSNTATGTVEVHIASAASNYQKRILETGTTFAPRTDGTWLMADYDRDGVPDLVFVKTSGAAPATVEVHVASGNP